MPKRMKNVGSDSDPTSDSDSTDSDGSDQSKQPVVTRQRALLRGNDADLQKMSLRNKRRRQTHRPSSEEAKCHLCLLTEASNPDGVSEELVSCSGCNNSLHPSCGHFPATAAQKIKSYSWRCTKCKICSRCHVSGDEATLICCSSCDRGYHSHCLKPAIKLQAKGNWTCHKCALQKPSIDSEIFSPEVSEDEAEEVQKTPRITRSKRDFLIKDKIQVCLTENEKSGSKETAESRESDDSSEDDVKPIRKRISPTPKDSDSDSERPSSKRSKERKNVEIDDFSTSSETDSEKSVRVARRNSKPASVTRKMAAVTVSKSQVAQNEPNEIQKKCPVPGCNSEGHLSGKYDVHSAVFACPIYHNLTPQQCKDRLENESSQPADENARNAGNSVLSGKKVNELKELQASRKAFVEPRDITHFDNSDQENDLDKSRQPKLKGFAPDFDLNLFLKAQAEAAESMEEQLATAGDSRGLRTAVMGRFEMNVWYQAPYPDEFLRLSRIYLCEFCLKYMRSATILRRHVSKCVWRYPPGDEIYRKANVSVFQVDGEKNKAYCQNLCLLAKLFLDHKTLYFDVEPFLFYVMTEVDNEGCHMIGYFSKEKNSFLNYNVSCILTLPPYQRQGYGRLLIDFSYLLTKVEQKIGSPEKPLSDLGLITYRSYWKTVLLDYMSNFDNKDVSIKDLSQETAINAYDIVSTLQYLGMIKYWKGRHIVLKRKDILDEHRTKMRRKGADGKTIDPTCLHWKPYCVTTAGSGGGGGSSGATTQLITPVNRC